MPKRNSDWGNRSGAPIPPGLQAGTRRWVTQRTSGANQRSVSYGVALALLSGCATPQYMIRPSPQPEESAEAIQIERTISAAQAEEFERPGTRPIGDEERLGGLPIQRIIDRLSRITERPTLRYRASLYTDRDPNAAALADGRIYISSGLVRYLTGRGSRQDEPFDSASPRSGRMPSEVEAELAFVLAHELAHTVAQHLVKRYRMLEQQQFLLALVAAGASAATQQAGPSAQQMGRFAVDTASLLRDVANSGYSQEQELEADQLGIRYVIQAGFKPQAALDLLRDFARFDNPWPLLRTHPYMELRYAYLERYLSSERDRLPELQASSPLAPQGPRARDVEEHRRSLRKIQRLYPSESISWTNLQRQIDALEASAPSTRRLP
ncbi:MAG: M48 family metalloprotease [Candidatus Omnitrophica bacterium]|nr:M48 family metalloprotease [Candidatus Omnitrophota bacterium]